MGTGALCCKPENSEGHIKKIKHTSTKRQKAKLIRSNTIKKTGDFYI